MGSHKESNDYFAPMRAVSAAGQSPDGPSSARQSSRAAVHGDAALRSILGFSANYRGDILNPRNRSAAISPSESTSLWLTGLPADTTTTGLMSMLGRFRPLGRIYATHISPPEDDKLPDGTSAAKVVFFRRKDAERLFVRARLAGGFKIRWNRTLVAEAPQDHHLVRQPCLWWYDWREAVHGHDSDRMQYPMSSFISHEAENIGDMSTERAVNLADRFQYIRSGALDVGAIKYLLTHEFYLAWVKAKWSRGWSGTRRNPGPATHEEWNPEGDEDQAERLLAALEVQETVEPDWTAEEHEPPPPLTFESATTIIEARQEVERLLELKPPAQPGYEILLAPSSRKSRVLLIYGHPGVVQISFLSVWIQKRCVVDIDGIYTISEPWHRVPDKSRIGTHVPYFRKALLRPPPYVGDAAVNPRWHRAWSGWSHCAAMEWRFGSTRCQAEAVRMAIRRELKGLVWAEYGVDPLEMPLDYDCQGPWMRFALQLRCPPDAGALSADAVAGLWLNIGAMAESNQEYNGIGRGDSQDEVNRGAYRLP